MFSTKITGKIPKRRQLYALGAALLLLSILTPATLMASGALQVAFFVLCFATVVFVIYGANRILGDRETGPAAIDATPTSVSVSFSDDPGPDFFATILGQCLDFVRTPAEAIVPNSSGLVSDDGNGNLVPVSMTPEELAELRKQDIAVIEKAQEDMRLYVSAMLQSPKTMTAGTSVSPLPPSISLGTTKMMPTSPPTPPPVP